MAAPTKYPALLTRADGMVAEVLDANSYNAGVAQGFSYPTSAATARSVSNTARIIQTGVPVTPTQVVSKGGSPTTTITYPSFNGEQDDGR